MKNWIRFPLVLAIICAVSAVGVGSVYVLTKEDIAEQQARARQEAREKIFGKGVTQKALNEPADPLETVYEIADEGGAVVGYMTIGISQGYSSKLQVMVGVDVKLTEVKRINILYQNETPGLGTRVKEVQTEKTWVKKVRGEPWPDESGKLPWFEAQFDGAKITGKGLDPSGVDTISGATISSSAAINAVNAAVDRIARTVHESAKGASDV